MQKIIKVSLLACALFIAPSFSSAQDTSTTQDAQFASELKALQAEVRAGKRELVEEQLKLSPEQASKFWPVFDSHQDALAVLNKRRIDNISAYANAWSAGSLEENTANSLAKEALSIEKAEAALMEKSYKKLKGKVPAATNVRYLQIESKLRALVRFEQAIKVPLAD